MTSNKKPSKIVLIISGIFCLVYFVFFIFPNATGSDDMAMLALFEPDEAVPYPYVLDMIKPASTVKDALINFAFYDYYFYGYPVFGFSALFLLPVKWIGLIDQIPINMLILRQMISVLPMIFSIWLLVYWRMGFKDYRSILLLLLLFLTPAVVQNNFWWHPDSLAILFAILVLFFLSQDNLQFKRNYYLAAIFCGFSAGTKSIGFYFFFTILIILILGLVKHKLNIQQVILHGIGFIIQWALHTCLPTQF